jgi:eukaryotic-like serine/threonine-protein kinase
MTVYAPQTPPVPTTVGDGRYGVLRLLGEGRHKRVYLGLDNRLEREVALAVLKPAALDEIGAATVWREAKAMARLSGHQNTVAVYDSGEDRDGGLYFVSEYVDGGELSALIDQAADRPLPIGHVLRIAADVTRALVHVHDHGIVHRDVKPGNVWMTSDGVAKLGDFGLSLAFDAAVSAADTMIAGTAAYIAPEYLLGTIADERADLYSLGVLIYELLCGAPPFLAGDVSAIVVRHLYTPPAAPSRIRPDVPDALDELVLALLRKDPSGRPRVASQVLAALESVSPRSRSSSVLRRLGTRRPVRTGRSARKLRVGFGRALAQS